MLVSVPVRVISRVNRPVLPLPAVLARPVGLPALSLRDPKLIALDDGGIHVLRITNYDLLQVHVVIPLATCLRNGYAIPLGYAEFPVLKRDVG
eukprot:COSAG02_NODE_1454_length_12536_cov_347.064163_2_plen_93_part_00